MLLKIKKFTAFLVTKTGLSSLAFNLHKTIYGNNFIRVVNYHDTHDKTKENFERQMQYLSKNYSPCTLNDLDRFFKTRKWHKKRPGLIISFDDGLKSNFHIAIPIIEKYGFTAWFFISPGFVNSKDKRHFANNNSIITSNPDTPAWKKLKEVSKHHVIGSHTQNHKRLGKLSLSAVKYEVEESKRILERNLKQNVKCFAWVGGELKNYTREANYEIKRQYEYIFQTNSAVIGQHTKKHQLQRTNIESFYPLYLVKFQLSGIMDILYWPKRRIIEKITR